MHEASLRVQRAPEIFDRLRRAARERQRKKGAVVEHAVGFALRKARYVARDCHQLPHARLREAVI
eukprot:7852015-Pyramimonas_sp.AAC.1